ncbi:MAG TPA: hypothetical protein VGA64_10740 [Candidatus Polarisedimenticolia bacterium]
MRIGVLLAGCGHYDGTDVHEAVLTLLALESAGEKPLLIAPAIDHERVVDHRTGDEIPGERRDILRESARFARHRIVSIPESRPEDLEALIIPGGYGPVVNFSTGFALREAEHKLHPDLEGFLRHFLDRGKPIGLISLGEIPVRLLLGQPIEQAPPPADPGQVGVDAARRLVHTPGFTGFARLGDVLTGIQAMIASLLRLMEERRREAGRAPSTPGAP